MSLDLRKMLVDSCHLLSKASLHRQMLSAHVDTHCHPTVYARKYFYSIQYDLVCEVLVERLLV